MTTEINVSGRQFKSWHIEWAHFLINKNSLALLACLWPCLQSDSLRLQATCVNELIHSLLQPVGAVWSSTLKYLHCGTPLGKFTSGFKKWIKHEFKHIQQGNRSIFCFTSCWWIYCNINTHCNIDSQLLTHKTYTHKHTYICLRDSIYWHMAIP